jgi:hypothetical protein
MRSVAPTLLLALASLPIPVIAGAQGLVTGKWSGSIIGPSGNVTTVIYNVARTGDSLSITLFDPAVGNSIPFVDLRQVGDSLLFTLAAGRNGARLTCKVVRQLDRAYEGPCSDAEGHQGRMRMIPPKNQ